MKFYKTTTNLVIILFILSFLTLIVVYIGIGFAKTGESYGPLWFYILCMFGLAWIWYSYLKVPFQITIGDSMLIEFRSILQRTLVAPDEIESMRGWGGGMIKVKYKGGTLMLFSQMDGLHDFISTVKFANPNIEIKGI